MLSNKSELRSRGNMSGKSRWRWLRRSTEAASLYCGGNGGRLADTNWSKRLLLWIAYQIQGKPRIRRLHFIHNIDYLKQVFICESIFLTPPQTPTSGAQWHNRLARGTYKTVHLWAMPRVVSSSLTWSKFYYFLAVWDRLNLEVPTKRSTVEATF